MTKREQDLQVLGLAYGNLALTNNHKPTRTGFKKYALEEMGFTEEEFDEWANKRHWWDNNGRPV